MALAPQPALASVSAYAVPRHAAPITLDLSGNLGPQVDPSIISATPRSLRAYPDARPLEADLAARLGVTPPSVLVTAGADDAIDRTCRAMLCPGRAAVVSEPGFVVTAARARLCGAEVRSVPWPSGDFPVEDAIIAGRGASVVVVTSPNNPTGASVTAAALRRLSVALPDALLLVDLAYAEYADEDLTDAALALPNAVVTRTLSKAWGLAGLRVGYVVGPPEVIGWLRASGLPYAVSQLALDTAQRWLSQGAEVVAAHVASVRRSRARIAAALALHLDVVPSSANFVFARGVRAAWLHDGLAGLGIGIRAFPGRPEVRIACPATDADLAWLLAAIASVLAPEVLLHSPSVSFPAALTGRIRTAPSGAVWSGRGSSAAPRARCALRGPPARCRSASPRRARCRERCSRRGRRGSCERPTSWRECCESDIICDERDERDADHLPA